MTRHWGLPPRVYCRQHLLGLNKELFQALGSIKHGKSLAGHLERGQIDPITMVAEKAIVTMEMLARGYNPQKEFDVIGCVLPIGDRDYEYNLIDLYCRCPECAERIEKGENK